MGPVGCCPRDCSTRKSSTCSDGGLEVFGGRDLKASKRWPDLWKPLEFPPRAGTGPPALNVDMRLLFCKALASKRDFLLFFLRFSISSIFSLQTCGNKFHVNDRRKCCQDYGYPFAMDSQAVKLSRYHQRYPRFDPRKKKKVLILKWWKWIEPSNRSKLIWFWEYQIIYYHSACESSMKLTAYFCSSHDKTLVLSIVSVCLSLITSNSFGHFI